MVFAGMELVPDDAPVFKPQGGLGHVLLACTFVATIGMLGFFVAERERFSR
jgi:hypothetical protein